MTIKQIQETYPTHAAQSKILADMLDKSQRQNKRLKIIAVAAVAFAIAMWILYVNGLY